MQPTQESFNIVITGSWNPSIFTQQRWVVENLCESDQSDVAIALPLNGPNLPPRIEFENILLYPQANLIKICPTEPTVEGIAQAGQVAAKIASLLLHTPIDAVGVNFGFEHEQSIEESQEKVSLSDTAHLESNFTVMSSQVARALKLADDTVLNLTIRFDDSNISFQLNFHHDFTNRERFSELLTPENINSYYQMAEQILRDGYDYQI